MQLCKFRALCIALHSQDSHFFVLHVRGLKRHNIAEIVPVSLILGNPSLMENFQGLWYLHIHIVPSLPLLAMLKVCLWWRTVC